MASSSLNGRVARLEAHTWPAPEPEPETTEQYMARCTAVIEKYVPAIVDNPELRAEFFTRIGQAEMTTAAVADCVFVDGQEAIRDDYDRVAAWLWLALFQESLEAVEAWLGVQNYYNLTAYQARRYLHERQP